MLGSWPGILANLSFIKQKPAFFFFFSSCEGVVCFLRFISSPWAFTCYLSVSHSHFQFTWPQSHDRVAAEGSHLGFQVLVKAVPLTAKTKQTAAAKCPKCRLNQSPDFITTVAILGEPFYKFCVLLINDKKYCHWIKKKFKNSCIMAVAEILIVLEL